MNHDGGQNVSGLDTKRPFGRISRKEAAIVIHFFFFIPEVPSVISVGAWSHLGFETYSKIKRLE